MVGHERRAARRHRELRSGCRSQRTSRRVPVGTAHRQPQPGAARHRHRRGRLAARLCRRASRRDIPADVQRHALLLLGVPVVVQIVVNRAAGLYGPVWRYASVEEGFRTIAAVAIGTGIIGAGARSSRRRPPAWICPCSPLLRRPRCWCSSVAVACGSSRGSSRSSGNARRDRQVRPGPDRRGRELWRRARPTSSPTRSPAATSTSWPSSTTTPTSSAGPFAASPCSAAPTTSRPCASHTTSIGSSSRCPSAEKEVTKPIIDRALRTSSQVKVLRPAADATHGTSPQRPRPRPLRPPRPRGRTRRLRGDRRLPGRAPRSSSPAGAARSAARSPARSPATGRGA